MSIIGDYVIPAPTGAAEFEGMTLPPFTPEIPRRQKMSLPYDLSICAIEQALKDLGGLDIDTTAFLVAAEGCRAPALAAAKEYRLVLILLPDEMCKNYSWAVVSAKGTVFSVPVY